MRGTHAEYRHIHSIMQENSERFGAKEYLVSVEQGKNLTFSQINQYCNRDYNIFLINN